MTKSHGNRTTKKEDIKKGKIKEGKTEKKRSQEGENTINTAQV
jgi:hypothetical protein